MIYSVTLWGSSCGPGLGVCGRAGVPGMGGRLVGGAESIDVPWLPADENGLEQLKQGNSTEG